MNAPPAGAEAAPSRPSGAETRPSRPGGGEWVRTALSPRMIGVLLILLLAAGVCIRLGAWQLDRAAVRGADAAQTEHAERVAGAPVPLSDVLRAQTSFPVAALGRPVTVVGSFDPDQQVLVPDREMAGEPATLVVTAFWVSEGPDAGAMLPVLRGWVAPEAVTTQDGRAVPVGPAGAAALAAPEGEREITGHLGGSEASADADHPEGMVGAISSGELANRWGGPSWSGYLVLADDDPAGAAGAPGDGLRAAEPPGPPGDTGLNIQNLAYAAEWWIFGGFALLLWWRMLRDEVEHRRDEAALAAG